MESPVTHGRASFSRYTLLPTFDSASIGCAHGICGGKTRRRSASATFRIDATASARKQCPTLPFTDPMPTSGPPGWCSPQSDCTTSTSAASYDGMPLPSASIRSIDASGASARSAAAERSVASGAEPHATPFTSA